MRKIDYKTIPSYLELNNKEVGNKLRKSEKEYPNFEHDLNFGNITLVLELNYDTNKFQYKEHYINGYKVS